MYGVSGMVSDVALYKIQSTLFMASGIPEDSCVNTLWCESTDGAEVVSEFVAALVVGLDTFRGHFPSTVRQTNHSVKTYLMSEPEPRAPINETIWSFSNAPAGNPAPPEIALCLSFQGDRVSGQSQARRRGRIYFGPLDLADVHTDGRPTSGLVTDLLSLGDTLINASEGMEGGKWVVWSPTEAASTVVTNGWVDNAFDIQRRRGVAATVRSTFDGT